MNGVLIVLGLNACGAPQPDVEQLGTGEAVRRDVIPVETLALRPREFIDAFEVTGLVEADDEVSVASETSGRVTHVGFERGDAVEKGALLVSLDDGSIQAQIKRLRATIDRQKTQLESAERNLQREKSLFEEGVGAEKAFDDAETQVRMMRNMVAEAEASLEEANVELRRFRIYSPIGGRVARRFVAVGEHVNPGSPLADIVKLDVIKFNVSLGERDVPRVSPGQLLEFSIDAYPGSSLAAPVTSIAPASSNETRTFSVTLTLDNAGTHTLLPGMSGKARVVREAHGDVFLIPEDALIREGEESWVYVVSDARAKRVQVEVVPSSGALAVIRGEFGANDECVILGQHALSPDIEVMVRRRHEEPPLVKFD